MCASVVLQVVIEGMGRAIHSNLRTRFKCPALKLAMIKNARLAARLFEGKVYDCVCIFDHAAHNGGADTTCKPVIE